MLTYDNEDNIFALEDTTSPHTNTIYLI